MAKLNIPRAPIHTHEGAKAQHLNPELQLRRSVMSCMLWEDEFYENGATIAERITTLIPQVDPATVANIAMEARLDMNLRHVPLLIAREMAKYRSTAPYVAATLRTIIRRADELAEFLALYWQHGKRPLSAQVKKGLAEAFQKFDAYQLAKYNRDGAVKLRDVLFLCHAKPKDAGQAATWKKLIEGTLEPPDTWEVALSSGADKKAAWERLLREGKLGALAVLRNLRNFQQAGVHEVLVERTLSTMDVSRVLPFRFIAAAQHAPQWEPQIEAALLRSLKSRDKLPGHTVLLLDVSESMQRTISGKSEISRMDAACGVGMIAREICEDVDIFSFSMYLCRIPPRHGFALRDAIATSQVHSDTPLGTAVRSIYSTEHITRAHFSGYGYEKVDYPGQGLSPDRLIVITDEQSADAVPSPATGKGYMVNVASAQNGIGYGAWVHIDGWSEAVLRYILALEQEGGLD